MRNLRRLFPLFVASLVAVLIGAGCGGKQIQPPPQVEPKLSATTTVRTTMNTISLMAGDTFNLLATDESPTSTKTKPETVEITRFIPRTRAELSWRQGSATGSLATVDLRGVHILFMPEFWPNKPLDIVGEKSTIWLSDDAFLALDRIGQLSMNSGFGDPQSAVTVKKSVPAAAGLWDKIMRDAAKESDPDFILGAQLISWPLYVNGRMETLPVLRARNWFGEYLIIRDREDPMIVGFTFDPQTNSKDIDKKSKAFLLLQRALSYQMNNFTVRVTARNK